MHRLKVILGLLLPALWLAAAGDFLSEPESGGPSGISSAWVGAAEPGKRRSATPECVLEQLARFGGRRAGTQCGRDEFCFHAANTEVVPLAPERVAIAFSAAEAALRLSQPWQLLWRVASDPRPPTLLS